MVSFLMYFSLVNSNIFNVLFRLEVDQTSHRELALRVFLSSRISLQPCISFIYTLSNFVQERSRINVKLKVARIALEFQGFSVVRDSREKTAFSMVFRFVVPRSARTSTGLLHEELALLQEPRDPAAPRLPKCAEDRCNERC